MRTELVPSTYKWGLIFIPAPHQKTPLQHRRLTSGKYLWGNLRPTIWFLSQDTGKINLSDSTKCRNLKEMLSHAPPIKVRCGNTILSAIFADKEGEEFVKKIVGTMINTHPFYCNKRLEVELSIQTLLKLQWNRLWKLALNLNYKIISVPNTVI